MFTNQYQHEFPQPDPDALRLAQSYVDETERFDQALCARRNRYGEAVPSTHLEIVAINLNAIAVWQRVEEECTRCGLDPNGVRQLARNLSPSPGILCADKTLNNS